MLITEDNIYEHVADLASGVRVDALGIVDRKNSLVLDGDDEVEIMQSLSLLHQESTGAVVWSSTPRFAKWISKDGPLHDLVFSRSIVELGAGTGALARLLAPRTKQPYLATDQKPLLKLTQRNCTGLDNVSIGEFDWELHEFDHDVEGPAIILACDTIYNSYLIEPFCQGLDSVMRKLGRVPVIVVVQLRDEDVLVEALTALTARYEVEFIEAADGLEGFGVYLLSA